MSRDYRGETGIIGTWKGLEVFVLTKEQYMDLPIKKDMVYVINDDNCRMIHNGDVVGVLKMDSGTVVEMTRSAYRPVVRREKAPAAETTSASGTEEFKYSDYSKTVDDFFSHLQDPIIIE
jgi:hypothetical protein